jgi:hypothetical protein
MMRLGKRDDGYDALSCLINPDDYFENYSIILAAMIGKSM